MVQGKTAIMVYTYLLVEEKIKLEEAADFRLVGRWGIEHDRESETQ